MENAKPDKVIRVHISEDLELLVSPAIDIMLRWRHLGYTMLKYYDAENHSFHQVLMGEEYADAFQAATGVRVHEATEIYESELEVIRQWRENNLMDLDFEVEDGTDT